MSELKKDIPRSAFSMEEKPSINIENEVMRKIDSVERKEVKPLGVRPQLMGVIIALFFFLLAGIGVLADVSSGYSDSWNINGWEVQKLFGRIPVQLHITILLVSGFFLVYAIYRSIRHYSSSVIRS